MYTSHSQVLMQVTESDSLEWIASSGVQFVSGALKYLGGVWLAPRPSRLPGPRLNEAGRTANFEGRGPLLLRLDWWGLWKIAVEVGSSSSSTAVDGRSLGGSVVVLSLSSSS